MSGRGKKGIAGHVERPRDMWGLGGDEEGARQGYILTVRRRRSMAVGVVAVVAVVG